ncbi:MAG TPA: sigma 54-interacting transcriptional regulator [Longimicrobiales bacterium]
MPAQDQAFQVIIGRSEAIQEAIALAYRVARSPIRMVLLAGETGTGKELFARGIHAASDRATEPFAALNCAAIPESLLESELFGHERGAFTGAANRKLGLLEIAKGGTVLLDEVAELSLTLQAKLLRVLEDRKARRVGGVEEVEINCRVIAATNESLEQLVARGAFREDLFYRLDAFRITLPPLRGRGADIEVLARHFLRTVANDLHQTPKNLPLESLAVLQRHEWRGNVRELKNVIERAFVLSEGADILPHHIVLHRRSPVSAQAVVDPTLAGQIGIPKEGLTLDEIEREAILITLRAMDGNQSKAARVLGISRATLMRKLQKFELERRVDISAVA